MTDVLRHDAEMIVRALRARGHDAWFAGGCVRDLAMQIVPKDYDIATSARPDEVMDIFPRTKAVGAQFGVVLVHADCGDYEVATFRADAEYSDGRHPDKVEFCSAREDVERRDFTINGMLYDPVKDETLDWVGGRKDIAQRLLRTIGEPDRRFAEDKLRMLRGVRFACRLGFAIEENTYDAIRRNAPGLAEVSAERIREELVYIFTGPHAGRALRLMHDMGLLRPILPEVEAMSGVEQPPQFHPEGDVFEHTCMMLDLAENPSLELAMGILLHDIGKPGTQTFSDRIRFNEHDHVGEVMVRSICRRLRFSGQQADQIADLVAQHMRFATAPRMKLGKLKGLLAMPRFDEHLELHRLDCLSSHRKLDVYDFVRQKLDEFTAEELRPDPLVDGSDLLALGYSQGPIFGRILASVREQQLDGSLNTRQEAVAYIGEHFPPVERSAQS